MNLATVIGVIVGFVAVFGGNIMEGGQITALINIPAAMIVFGGTVGVGFIAFSMGQMVSMPKVIMKAFFGKAPTPHALVAQFVSMAETARREGLLALESASQQTDDAFTKKGLLLMIDGTDPELLREILEIDIEAVERRHEENYKVLEALGGFAPTLGIIGTVLGLISVLGNLANPEDLGHSIAGAFIATFYGVFSANLWWLPLAAKLKAISKDEKFVTQMAMEAILSIQSGDNPRVVQEKLDSFVSPKHRGHRANAEPAVEEREAA